MSEAAIGGRKGVEIFERVSLAENARDGETVLIAEAGRMMLSKATIVAIVLGFRFRIIAMMLCLSTG